MTQRFPIIGIGASAGGIQALKGFFEGMGDGCSGMAFVIVTHLNPDRESLLRQIVERYTPMPVRITQDGEALQAGHVYVMPQNTILSIKDRAFQVRAPSVDQRERNPVDIFLSALACDQGEYSAGIILSGGDGDGTLGIKAIKERGGLTLAQVADASGPVNPHMPDSAIGTGLIDIAAPVEKMGEKLEEFARSFSLLSDLQGKIEAPISEDAGLHEAQVEIYALLHRQVGHDFSGYKKKTFVRRVHRRMQVVQAPTIQDYVQCLKESPDEVRNLFRDLLINVTNFFRDTDAFDLLARQVLPDLFTEKTAADTIRIWIPGCATGEEVYSIAILMREHMAGLPSAPRVQIFATDIDDAALGVARAGRFPEALMAGVSKERRDRFFVSDGSAWVVKKEVREMCIFSPHSVIKDPPFSRMDMVSCRNLLIYFGPMIQDQVFPIFHYALKPAGYLFLGMSESISRHGELFSALDKKHRIFQRRPSDQTPRLPINFGPRAPADAESAKPFVPRNDVPLRSTIEAHVLERFSPAYVVVDEHCNVVYYSGRTGRFLEPPQGVPNKQLLAMARKGLQLDLRAAMREAVEHGRTTTRDQIFVDEGDDQVQPVSITVEPLPPRGKGRPHYVVLFTLLGPVRSRHEARMHLAQDHDGAVGALERELRDTRERLQGTIEEYETALEELKSSNEELVSVNEEAQSTNEELEASKEEMQSLNEELSTINAELSSKVDELDRANNDLRNLFDSTEIATVFLDRNLVIRNFTPAASCFFNLRPADIGRPLTDLAGYVEYPQLKTHIQQVADEGASIEYRLTRGDDGTAFLVRLNPYREASGLIRGVVVSFVDVTNLVEAESFQKVLVEELNHRVKNMLTVAMTIIQQTARSSATKDEMVETVLGRMGSLARAYGSLSHENWKVMDVARIIHQELEPFGLERVTLLGDSLEVPPESGISIGMIVHELATNAAKYGALAVAGGHVEAGWEVVTGATRPFRFTWRERGGPAAKEPKTLGFGMRLIKAEVERHQGLVTMTFGAEGLTMTMECGLSAGKPETPEHIETNTIAAPPGRTQRRAKQPTS
jgi:two-component system CheB/CheR fusion protein